MKDVCTSAAERAAQLASAIKAVGIKAGGRVGIYAPNVPNWMLVIQACNRSSLQVGEPVFKPQSTQLMWHSLGLFSCNARLWCP